jgi:hypothetical protein
MSHRDKDFWLYVCAYLGLGSALLIIVLGILDMTVFGRPADLGGAAAGLLAGTLLLSSLKRKENAQEGAVIQNLATDRKGVMS